MHKYPDRPKNDDEEREGRQALSRLAALLARAFVAPESAYRPLTAANVIARNAYRPSTKACK